MKKKVLKIILVVICVLVALWSGMLITDTVKSQRLSEPVFAQVKECVFGDVLIYKYQGLGYTIKSEYFTDQYGQSYIGCSEVYLFGKIMILAVIT